VADSEAPLALTPGTPILVGDRLVPLPEAVAREYRPGDRLLAVRSTGEILRVPRAESELVTDSVARTERAFEQMRDVSDDQISSFFEAFAAALERADVWEAVSAANARDVEEARAKGRSTTRLVADAKLRSGMIEGLRGWIDAPSRRGQILETVQHDDFEVELVGDALGIVAFVFEGRPNVLADACGVIRGGNSVIFRIGSDALGTARALMSQALEPARESAGLPAGVATLLDSPSRAAGWALFSDSRLSLAVARGSGPTVDLYGALARSAGLPVSLHGTGGAWMVTGPGADATRFAEAVLRSLDRKVCNTLNTCCILRDRADELVPILLERLEAAGRRRGQSFKLHVLDRDRDQVPAELFERRVNVARAEGDIEEPQAELISEAELGKEWEWEETPEVSLALVDSVDQAVEWFNRYSPRFVATLIEPEPAEHARFFARVDAAFVGDAHTRWVDGQFALSKPELGLSNWQSGRLFGRGGILSGDSVFTVRTRYRSRQS